MNVNYRKRGESWQIRFRKIGKKETTKTYPGSLQERTIKRKADWYKEEYALGRFDPWMEKKDRLVEEALFQYLDENLTSGNWAENSTYKTNKSVLTRMLKPVYTEKIRSVKKWQDLFDDLPGSAYTKKGDRGRLNTFLNYCLNKGWVDKRIRVKLDMEDVIEMRNRSNIKHITWDQLDRICKAHRWLSRQNHLIFGTHGRKPDGFYEDIWWFYFYSLLRKEELPKLKVRDLTRDGQLRVRGKGRRTDHIYLPPPALEIARRHTEGKTEDQHLFVSHVNRAEIHLKSAVRLALGDQAPSEGFHMLRHGGVVHYFTLGKPIQFISKLCRHANTSVTMKVYGDVLPDGMKRVFSDITHSPPE